MDKHTGCSCSVKMLLSGRQFYVYCFVHTPFVGDFLERDLSNFVDGRGVRAVERSRTASDLSASACMHA